MEEVSCVKKYLDIMREGNLKSKLSVILHILTSPLHPFYKNPNRLVFNVTLKNEEGIFLCGDNVYTAWSATTQYKQETKKYFHLSEGTFVDVGAYIGKYAILLAKELGVRGRVVAIEPEEYNFKLLKENIKLNNLENVILVNTLCFSEEKQLDFYLNPIRRGQHSIFVKSNKKIKIQARKLDNLLSDLNINDVGLIKLDVEGAEAHVLKGALNVLKKTYPKLIFEAWNEDYLNQVRTILEPLNYNIIKIGDKDYFAFRR